jgi:hypothetical protein
VIKLWKRKVVLSSANLINFVRGSTSKKHQKSGEKTRSGTNAWPFGHDPKSKAALPSAF